MSFSMLIQRKWVDPIAELLAITQDHGYDDVFVYVPVKEVAEMGDKLLAFDGCMNFFAGPSDSQFKAEINLYNCPLHKYTYYGNHRR